MTAKEWVVSYVKVLATCMRHFSAVFDPPLVTRKFKKSLRGLLKYEFFLELDCKVEKDSQSSVLEIRGTMKAKGPSSFNDLGDPGLLVHTFRDDILFDCSSLYDNLHCIAYAVQQNRGSYHT